MVWQTILTVLASLSIPSVAVNVFLYIQSRKHKKWESKRDLELKKIEFEEEMVHGQGEYDKVASPDARRINTLINRDVDYVAAADVLETSKRKLRKISAEMDYLYKMSGEPQPFVYEKSLWGKIKSKFKK